jgi:hypothetical protein
MFLRFKLSKKGWIIAGSVAGIIVIIVGFLVFAKNDFEITNDEKQKQEQLAEHKSPLTGLSCETYDSRPFAVMVSSDKEARPLSGIGEADWVFEMPVVENGFTRMMAVFQCGRPKEIGSVRSSRLDFVPLALGINAIYAHFGGEHAVLEELNSGIINNIDGLKYDGTYYYRKSGIPKPHNAFTDFKLLADISGQLGYDMTDAKVSYPHEEESVSRGTVNPGPLFKEGFTVDWKYNANANTYSRTRIGKAEIDKNTGKQVETKNVVVMKTTWSPISKDYIRVKTVGSGGLLLYKDGIVVTGTWEKKDDNAKLYFYDANHEEIELANGNVWVEVVTTN